MTRSNLVSTLLCTVLAGSTATLASGGGFSDHEEPGVRSLLVELDQKGNTVGMDGRKIRLNKDRLETYSKLRVGEQPILERLPLSDGRIVDVELGRVEILNDDAYVRVMRPAEKGSGRRYREERVSFPDVVTLSGRILDEPESIVFLSIDGDNVMGYVRSMSGMDIISSGKPGQLETPMVHSYESMQAASLPAGPARSFCGLGDMGQVVERQYPEAIEAFGPSGGVAGGMFDCKRVRMSIDIDPSLFYSAFDGNQAAALSYVIQLATAQNQIYTRDAGIHLGISRVTLWEVQDSPWTQPDDEPYESDTHEQLYELREWYLSNVNGNDYDLAHLLMADNLGGGIAFRGSLCSEYPFAVSTDLDGAFPHPNDYETAPWDLMVFVHENGHVLDAMHTHEFCPPIDSCASGLAQGACQTSTACQRGTIMSYCHTCPGGLRNIDLRFHPENVLRMRNHLAASSCVGSMPSDITAFDDEAVTIRDSQVAIDVLVNDLATCEQPALAVLSTTTEAGGTVEVINDTEPYGQNEILYTPPAGFVGTDSFTYIASVALYGSQDTAQVEIEVTERPTGGHEFLVLDSIRDAVYRFNKDDGRYLGALVQPGAGGLDGPSAFDVDARGHVYICSKVTDDVRVFDGVTGISRGIFLGAGLKNPAAIRIHGQHAYILGADREFEFPFSTLPRVKLVKVELETGEIVGSHLGPFGVGRALDVDLFGSLVMIQGVDGRELVVFDTDSMMVTAEHALDELGLDNPISVIYSMEFSILDGDARSVATVDENCSQVQGVTAWRESNLIDFNPRQILVHDYKNYVVDERGVSMFTSGWLYRRVVISPEHLQSPVATLVREAVFPEPADFNGDGMVNGADLAVILSAFGTENAADLTGDGYVDGADLAMVLAAWSTGTSS